MFSTLLILFAVCVIGLLLYAAIQPDQFTVTRSTMIVASPEKIFEYVNDLRQWYHWSPWAKIDPHAKSTFEGPFAGVGAIFRWDGNNQLGAGSMTITESTPSELIRFQLDFLRPFKGTNMAVFTFKQDATQTLVTWTMTGTNKNVLIKAVGILMNCDKIIKGQFDKGLAQLKILAEKP